jgi:tRNA (adenine22-N1)-methyltransferase
MVICDMYLPKRLSSIAVFVPPGKIVADIGTDHALLPVYLVQSGRCQRVIATELKAQPWKRACLSVQVLGLEKKIDVRLGNGLKALSVNEAQVAVVAGMGGKAISQALEACPEVLDSLERLILQPMKDASALRFWLINHGWRISEEAVAEEEGRLYVIIVAEPGRETVRDPLLIEIGPCLAQGKDPLSVAYLNKLEANYQQIAKSLKRGRSPRAREKAIQINALLVKIRDCLAKNNRISLKKHHLF